jgi:uncharacterized protein (DUF58 family)
LSTLSHARSWLGQTRQRFWRLAPADQGPVVLRHHRIYILPTPRGWALIATLLVMLVTSSNYALSLGYGFTFLLAGLVSSALLHTFRNLAGISAASLAVSEAFAGGSLAFTLSLANPGAAREDITLAAADGTSLRLNLPGGATRPVTLDVSAATRGMHALGRVTMSSDFPLGLWRGWAYVHFPFQGAVYPAPEAATAPFPPSEDGSDAQRMKRGPEVEFFGLRDYRVGDPLRRIAWKAVARGAGWYTKEFHGDGGNGALAFDWMRLPAGMDVEARLSRICAWVLAAEREGRPFSLTLPGTALPAGHGAAHRRAALTALALYSEPR